MKYFAVEPLWTYVEENLFLKTIKKLNFSILSPNSTTDYIDIN
jgi:hypothetical protein